MNKILTIILSLTVLCTGMFFMSACNETKHKAIQVKIGDEVKEFNNIDNSVLEYMNEETAEVVKIKLYKDVNLSRGIMLKNNEFEINLNGRDIALGEGFENNYMICVNNGAKVTISGKGVINASSQELDGVNAIFAHNGEVVINDGIFTNVGTKSMEDNGTTPNNNELIYATNGVITINDGKFIGNYENETFGARYALNILDSGTGEIIVKGGEFGQYNPEESLSENPQANFVAEGYGVDLERKNNIDWYVVSPKNTIQITIGNQVYGFENIDSNVIDLLNTETAEVVKIKLYKDLVLTSGITLSNNEFVLDLNKYEITAPNSQSTALFKVVTGAKLTINGTGVINSASQANDYSMAVWARGGEVIINGGTFTNVGGADFEIANPNASNNNELLYVGGKDGSVYVGGTITINGGKFVGNYENETWSTRYTLNILDADTNAQIIVKGGEFRQYNPEESLSENPQANFVAEGYGVDLERKNNVDWYVVSQKNTIQITIGNQVYGFENIDSNVIDLLNTETAEVVKIKLYKDLVLTTTCFYFTTNVYEFDLNGYNISYPTDTVGDGIFCVSGDAELTINGNGVIDAASQANDYSMAVWALENGKVTINGGTFTNVGAKSLEDDGKTPNNNELIYARDNSVITINAGKFIGNYENETYGVDIIRFVLNIKDKHAAQIIVKGGEFRQYNPEESLSEYPQANFVAEGFQCTLDARDGVDWYVVSQESQN